MRKLAVVFIILLLAPGAAMADRCRGWTEAEYESAPQAMEPELLWITGMGKGRGGAEFMSELGLSDGQIESMRKIRLDMRREMVKVKSELDLKKIDFQEELQKDSPDKARLDKLIGEISALSASQTRARLESRVKMVEILTPEQRKKMMERMGAAMMGRMRHGPGADDDDDERGPERERSF